jgi:hypothetical protein
MQQFIALCIPPGCSKTKLGIFTFFLFHYFGGNTIDCLDIKNKK